jgi:Carboxypeptidase regulatory-like domain/TonB dependent receptor
MAKPARSIHGTAGDSHAFQPIPALALFVMLFGTAYGQVATGTITGSVLDSSGATVPSADVEVKNEDMGLTRNARTDDTGGFRFTLLPVGRYSVSGSAKGFRKKVISGLVLQVDQTAEIKVSLEPGLVSETVTVQGTAPLLESETSSVGQVISNNYIEKIPLNGRNPYALGLLSGHTARIQGTSPDGLPFIAGGARYETNEVLLDGVDNNTYLGRGIAFTPSVDAVQEFKVKTSAYTAEFGRSAGMVLNATLKSGTNDVHGSLFEFLRNDKLDANNFFSNAASLRKAPLRRNEFGGTFGAPVFIPKLYNGRNKTFVFGDAKIYRQRTGASSTLQDVPPLSFRKGDLSNYRATNGAAIPIYDPATRTIGADGKLTDLPFAGNQIPSNRIFPGAAAIADLIPQPNVGGPESQASNFLYQAPRGNNLEQFDIRVDENFANSNTMFGRYSQGSASTPNPGIFPGFLGGGGNSKADNKQLALGDTHIFSPRLLNEFRFGFRRGNNSNISTKADGVDFANKNAVALFPFPVLGFPEIDFNFSGQRSGAAQFSNLAGGGSSFLIENVFQWSDNVTWTHGTHSTKAGFDLRRYRIDRQTGDVFNGRFFFGSIYTANPQVANSGAPFADFLLGLPSLLDGTQQLDWSRLRQIYGGAFIQDDWKVNARLTLNYGLRYDLWTVPVDARNRGSFFDASVGRFVLPGSNGYSRGILQPNHKNFSPRFGAAFQVTQKLVLRAGYGIFFGDSDRNASAGILGSQIPNVPIIATPPVDPQRTTAPPFTMSTPIPVSPFNPDLSTFNAQNPIALTLFAPDFHNTKPPYLQEYSFSIQYAPAANWLTEVSYEGSKGTHLGDRVNLQQLPFESALSDQNTQAFRRYPFINGLFAYDTSTATSNYNSVNFKVERRFSRGLALLANYSIQKTLERGVPGTIGTFDQNGGTSLPLDSYNLQREVALAPLDIPQNLTFSYTYELPFGPGKGFVHDKGPAGKIIGGWSVNGITSFRSGFPTDIRFGRQVPIFSTHNVPDRVTGQPLTVPNAGPDQFFNPAAFSAPPTVLSAHGNAVQTFGNAAKRVARGPGSRNWDFAVFKDTRIHERLNLQFRTEIFNLFNTPQFGLASASSPSLTIGNPNFGKLVTSADVGRQIQFALKLLF